MLLMVVERLVMLSIVTAAMGLQSVIPRPSTGIPLADGMFGGSTITSVLGGDHSLTAATYTAGCGCRIGQVHCAIAECRGKISIIEKINCDGD